MNPPREPRTWKHPRLYILMCKSDGEFVSGRIIYPNGTGDNSGYCDFASWGSGPNDDFACWQIQDRCDASFIRSEIHPKLAKRARKQMFEYLRLYYSACDVIYCGEIK